ncbi:hypothetical protein ABT369_57095 [Dactylosporangium sp. NPDC000244]|uniref:hypothetical protein n=1 Tax=Dactylosporangium sp. NPDC000244 TaxID=3154365 RepID=UPI003322209D
MTTCSLAEPAVPENEVPLLHDEMVPDQSSWWVAATAPVPRSRICSRPDGLSSVM